jgi:hypothetical protein
MNTDTDFSFLDLLDLPELQNEIVLYITRNSPAEAGSLAQALERDPTEVGEALAALVKEGRVRLLPDGQADVVMGRVKSRTTLPPQFWNALLTTGRTYSEKDIAVLRTAVPILQFARARLSEFSDHGPGHALRVKSFAGQFGYIMGLSQTEHMLLRAGALFHDIGNAVDRAAHHTISEATVKDLTANGELPFTSREAEVVGRLCRWHRREYDPDHCDELENGEMVRTGLMASILRVADAMDIDHRRSDYSDRFANVLRMFFPQELPFWNSLEEILGLRIRCTPAVNLQVFMRETVPDNMQVAMLRGDLTTTPLDWSVQEIVAGNGASAELAGIGAARVPAPGSVAAKPLPALLVFPFEPNSLVMAALSRKHLAIAGHQVELLCYPDTAGGTAWLWGEVLPATDPADYGRLVVIGDRPEAGVSAQLLETVEHWQASHVQVGLLNRHEASWPRLPDLLQRGVDVVLGGDWAYFWGDEISRADLAWGRVAALCARDPTLSTVGLTWEEQAVARGLLKTVCDAASNPACDVDGWLALAEPILDHITADNRAYFAEQVDTFTATYATMPTPGVVDGRVLRFDRGSGVLLPFEQASGTCPHAYYWALEAAIEGQGRATERGIKFNVPYAMAAWPDGDDMEILALNHWLDEDAVPIRFLYPADLGPVPGGNECTVQVRIPVLEAEIVVRALVDACNRA